MRVSRRRGLVLLALFAVAATAALLRGCFLRPGTAFRGEHFDHGTNAAWLGVEWVSGPHDSGEVTLLAEELAQRKVRYAFVYTSYLKAGGQFNPTYTHAAGFVRALKAAAPDLNVQAWIGLPLRQGRLAGAIQGGADLGDPSTRNKIVAFCAGLVRDYGFDGVHLDPEPVVSGDEDVLALLEELRAAVRPGTTMSMATPRIQPLLSDVPLPLIGRYAWRASYYRQVAARVDQIAVMTYDSALPLPQLYRQWGRFQTVALTQALAGSGVQLFIGIPTSEEWTWTHWPGAENMGSGLQGLVDGLNDAAARPEVVTGVAVYPYWETDAAEWGRYQSLWLGE